MNVLDSMNKSLLGLYCNDPEFIAELEEVQTYYEFYEGRPYSTEDREEDNRGQLWKVNQRDYKPTREIRNLTKKLIKKQGRFMTSIPPTIRVTSINGNTDREKLDAKRGILEEILQTGNFWNKFNKAFLDCTIGKRVLLCLGFDLDNNGVPKKDSPLKFRFYTMPEFTYEFDPNDVDKLVKVQIAYQDKSTIGRLQREQRWHKWTYELKTDNRGEESCWCTYEIVDGTNSTAFLELSVQDNEDEDTPKEQIELKETWNTYLSMIPCKVIFNEGLTGDIKGHSDIKDLIDLATNYNKTYSDYRDALRFKMFEQPVFKDCDSSSLAHLKIAPNAIIDIKSDPALGDGSGGNSVADYGTLSSTFNFQPAADSYLASIKRDMYELMEQPLPETLLNVPSGKALKMVYYDLITRCEEKWAEWDEALMWLISLIEECIVKFNLYADKKEIESIRIDTVCSLKHNYPIPDDEADTKATAIKEVEANVRSHKSYIEEFGYAEDADSEFETILEEIELLNSNSNSLLGIGDLNSPLLDNVDNISKGDKEEVSQQNTELQKMKKKEEDITKEDKIKE